METASDFKCRKRNNEAKVRAEFEAKVRAEFQLEKVVAVNNHHAGTEQG